MTVHIREVADAQFLAAWPSDDLPKAEHYDAAVNAWDAWSEALGYKPQGAAWWRWREAMALKAILTYRGTNSPAHVPGGPVGALQARGGNDRWAAECDAPRNQRSAAAKT